MTSEKEARDRRRPGRPARLSREAIVTAAEEMVAAEGIAALSMRRIAERLGSAPMSLYRHVADKDELMALLLDRVAARIPRPPPPDNPSERLLLLWKVLHDEFARYDRAVDVLRTEGLSAPSARWLVDAIAEAFLACGLSAQEAAEAYWCVWLYTVGELGAHAPRAHGLPPIRPEDDGAGLRALRTGSRPVSTEKDYGAALVRILRGWLPAA